MRNKLDKKRIKGKYRLAGGFMCATGRGDQGKPGLYSSIILKGRVSIQVHPALIKTSGLKRNSTTALGSSRAHTTCATGGEWRYWGGMGTAGRGDI